MEVLIEENSQSENRVLQCDVSKSCVHDVSSGVWCVTVVLGLKQ